MSYQPMATGGSDAKRLSLAIGISTFIIAGFWALMLPALGTADEPAHYSRVLAAARVDFEAPHDVQGFFSAESECFIFQPDIPSTCSEAMWDSTITSIESKTEGYSHFYYILMSLPSIFAGGSVTSFLFTRLWGALLASIIVGRATYFLLKGTRRSSYYGLLTLPLLALPTSFMGSVNPSGLTYAVGYLLGAQIFTLSRKSHLPQVLSGEILLTAAAFLLLRRDSIFFIALPSCFFVYELVRRARSDALKVRRKNFTFWTISLLTLGTLLFGWLGLADYAINFVRASGGPSWNTLKQGLDLTYTFIYQMLSVFGWLTTPTRNEIFVLTLMLVGIAFLLPISIAQKGQQWSVGLTFLFLLCSGTLLNSVRSPYVQGRYLLPALSIFLAASLAACLAESSFAPRATFFYLVASLQSICLFGSFYAVAHRFSVGLSSPVSGFNSFNPGELSLSSSTLLLIGVVPASVPILLTGFLQLQKFQVVTPPTPLGTPTTAYGSATTTEQGSSVPK